MPDGIAGKRGSEIGNDSSLGELFAGTEASPQGSSSIPENAPTRR